MKLSVVIPTYNRRDILLLTLPTMLERISEEMVYSWRPVPDDPKLLLLYCPDCGDRVEINHV